MMYKIKLSPYHKVFYNDWQLDPLSSKYNITFDQILYGNLNVEKLKKALIRYVQNNVLLNSHIEDIEEDSYWVKNHGIFELDFIDYPITHTDMLDFVSEKFDIYNGPLYRFRLVKVEPTVFRFVLVFHHLLLGGIPSNINKGIFEAISKHYNDENSISNTPDTETQIKLIAELTETLDANLETNRDQYNEFWHNKLQGIEKIDLSFLKNRTHIDNKNINPVREIRFIHKDLTLTKLNKVRQRYMISPYIYSLCILAVQLFKYTQQRKFAISYPIAIKGAQDFIYGVQVNTNLIPYTLDSKTTVIDLFNQTKDHFLSIKKSDIDYSSFPINEILQKNNRYLLDIIFLQANLRDTCFELNGITKVEISSEFYTDLFNPFEFEQEFRDNQINYRIRYNKNLIDDTLINEFILVYQKLFLNILTNLDNGIDDRMISEYSILSVEKYNQLIYEWNKTEKTYPTNKLIHTLFEEQALKTPNKIALIYENASFTYKQLNELTNQIAHFIKNTYKIKPDDLITLLLDRSEYMIISIIAALKSGGGYVPISPDYPKNRIEYILANGKPKLTIINEKYNCILPNTETPILAIDSTIIKKSIEHQPQSNPTSKTHSKSLAYVLYTSGTTGNPKGVLLEHASCVNRILEIINISGITGNESVLFKTNYIFDVSFSDIFVTLLSGACLIVTKETFNMLEIISKIKDYAIDICHFTPSQFNVIKSTYGFNVLNQLKTIHLSGEALDYRMLNGLNKNTKCINYYGPTEAGEVSADPNYPHLFITNIITIGKAFNNIKFYILDANLAPLPIGAIGELYIGGVAIARGYLNDSKLTKEKFIPNPFQTREEKKQYRNTKLYKTGDLCRYLQNGKIEYIGRNDSQIKLMGYRIEITEIETTITNYPGIKQAIVLSNETLNDTHTNIENTLICYYVAEHKLDELKIQEYLLKQIPTYMMPSIFIHINRIPLTQTGKLDIAILPKINNIIENNYVPPRNQLELKICSAYEDILKYKKNKIGIKHDFFKSGGNSLRAIQLVARLQHDFKINVTDVFKLRTPEKIVNSVPFIKDNLHNTLEQIKLIYTKQKKYPGYTNLGTSSKYTKYIQNVNHLKFKKTKKNIHNVLLTGVTGHLGCNLLYQLLLETNYKIFILVRAKSQKHAYSRVSAKFKYYFNTNLDLYTNRLVILAANLENEKLDLADNVYNTIVAAVDSIIHAAGLVKHYGNYDDFYKSNVQATINLLELAKLTHLKDFHYISTIGVFMNNYSISYDDYVFDEYDTLKPIVNSGNFYIQTKHEGELIAIKYRRYGVNSSIYRIGNLAMNSNNSRTQENIEENAFFNKLKTIVNIGMISQEISNVEISPVNLVAIAITKLFDQTSLSNQTHHIFNPNLCNLAKILSTNPQYAKIVSIDEFVNRILVELDTNQDNQIELFALHQLWLQSSDFVEHSLKVKVVQDKTFAILKEFNFTWPTITAKILSQYY